MPLTFYKRLRPREILALLVAGAKRPLRLRRDSARSGSVGSNPLDPCKGANAREAVTRAHSSKKTMRICALTLALSCIVAAQSKLTFEVVAIKPVPQPTPSIRPGADCFGMKIDGSRARICGYSSLMLLSRAFRVPLQQVVAPDFARSQFFEVQATLPEGATGDQVPEMLQAMLAERFKLAYHRETRDYPLSFLKVGKSGMKLPRLPDNTPPSTRSTTLPEGGRRITEVGKVASLFPVMDSFGGLQMVDETGLDGIYSWVRQEQPVRPGLTFRDVVQEAFRDMIEAAGLKLETRKGPKDTIVVDHLEKVPTEN